MAVSPRRRRRRLPVLLAALAAASGITVPVVLGAAARASFAAGLATPGQMTTLAGNGSWGIPANGASPTGASLEYPYAVAVDSAGDTYIADRSANDVQEIPATTGIQWGGMSMTAGDIYTIAGSASGQSGSSIPTGSACTGALFNTVASVALDPAGDIYLADMMNNRVVELAATTHVQWGISMTAGQCYVVAGTGTSGDTGTPASPVAATSAELDQPDGVALDHLGNLYIADAENHRVAEVAATSASQWGDTLVQNDLETILGSTSGSASGTSPDGTPAAQTRLHGPGGLAFDANGDLYVADTENNRVVELPDHSGLQWQKNMTANDLYTVAGSMTGIAGSAGAGTASTAASPASEALLQGPEGVALDAAGNLYISDTANQQIVEVPASTGTQWGLSVNAGDAYDVGGVTGTKGSSDGTSTSATLDDPQQIATDPAGDVFIADSDNNKVREMTADAASASAGPFVWRVAGDGVAGVQNASVPGTEQPLSAPAGTFVDHAGNLYIADSANNRVEEIPATSHSQWGLQMTAGNMYTILGSAGGTAGSSASGTARASTLLDDPTGLFLDDQGDLYVADTKNYEVQELAANSGTEWGTAMTKDALYVVAGTGTQGSSGTGGAASAAELNKPTGLAMDWNGDLYIADAGANQVDEVASESGSDWGQTMAANDLYVVAGTGTAGTGTDGVAATQSALNAPAGVALDSGGDLYVADTGNSRVQEVAAASGTQWDNQSMTANDVYTVAGDGTAGAGGDGGPATSAQLSGPTAVALDAEGNLYVADAANNRIQEVAASGGTQWGQYMTAYDAYTVAGSSAGTAGASGDGWYPPSVKIANPQSLALGASGNLYLADTGNSDVDELTRAGVGAPLGTLPAAPGDITSILGQGRGGGSGSQAAEFQLNGPKAVLVDPDGDVIVADSRNNQVVEVAATNHTQFNIAMTAGDAYILASGLNTPKALALDPEGDLYIADTGNNQVKELAGLTHSQWDQSMSAGQLYVVAGASTSGGTSSLPSTRASLLLSAPDGLAVQPNGDLAIADSGNNRVLELAAVSGTSFGSAMTADNAYGIATSSLSSPAQLALDPSGNLDVADYGNDRIVQIAATNGALSTIAGVSGVCNASGNGVVATAGDLCQPVGVSIDASGDLYIADDGSDRILEVPAVGGTQWGMAMSAAHLYTVAGTAWSATFAGDGGPLPSAHLTDPAGVAVDDAGDLFIADTDSGVVREATPYAQLLENGGPMFPGETNGGANLSEAGGAQPSRSATDESGTGMSVDLATGVVSVSATDDNLSSRAPGFGLTRTYSSSQAAVAGPFGYGWTDSYAMSVGADPLYGSSVIDVHQENGSVLAFVALPSGGYAPPPRAQATLSGSASSGWTFTRHDGTVYSFNSSGQLTSITDRNNDTTTLTYSSGELATVGDGSGRQLSFTWGSCGSNTCVTAVSEPGALSDSYSYSGSGDLTGVSQYNNGSGQQLVTSTNYAYDAAHRISSIENGLAGFSSAERTTTISYNDADQIESMTDPMGNKTAFSFALDPSGTGTTSVTDPMGVESQYGFVEGVLARQVLGAGTSAQAATTDVNDPLTDEPVATTNPDGYVTLSFYDPAGDATETLDPLGTGTVTTYDGYGNVLTSTSRLGETTSTSYNTHANPTTTSWPLPSGATASSTNTYGSSSYPGDITSSQDANTNTTTYSYDSYGNQTCSVDGAGRETTSYYGASGSATLALGQEVASVSGVGNGTGQSCPSDGSAGVQPSSSTYETTYTYDYAGNPDQTTGPQTGSQTHITKSTYDQVGDVLTETDADSNVTTNTYNADHELVSVQLPGGNCSSNPTVGCITYTYNADGQKTSVTDADGNTTSYAYDALGHLLTSTNALDETYTYTYDPAGNQLSVEQPNTEITRYSYNADGEVLVTTQPDQTTLTNTYDEAGNKTSYTDAAGNTTTYAYNDLGELTSTTNPIGETTSFTYDKNGNKLTEHDPDGNTTTWSYNGDNEVTAISYSGGPGSTHSVSMSYTLNGKISQMTDATGTSTYSYDASDELTSYTNGSGQVVSYPGYDGNGNPLSITYPGAHTVTETYNNRNEIASVTDWSSRQTAFCYDQSGNLTGIDFNVTSSACSSPSDALTQTNTYNTGEQLTEISDVAGGSTVESFSYGRGPDGLATSETTVGTPSAGSESYGYNSLLELTSAGSSSYGYNSANDLTTGPNNVTQSFNGAGALCWSGSGSGSCSSPPSGATRYAYSSVGNRTTTTPASGSVSTYGWNDAHQMTSVASASSSQSYSYDGNGLLTSESGSSGSSSYLWSPDASLPLLLSDGTNYYLYGPGATPIEQINSSTGAASYYLNDDVGSVRGLVSTSGSLQKGITYDAWGNVKATSGSGATTPFSFAGGYKDAASGLLYFRARWYDAVTGQWMSIDPLVMDTQSPYAYTQNDPTNGSDPTGLITFPTRFLLVEYGGLGKYEAEAQCPRESRCNVEWFLSLKPVLAATEDDLLAFQVVVDGVTRPRYTYGHLEAGTYRWHGYVGQPVHYGSVIHVHLLIAMDLLPGAIENPDTRYATGTQLWHIVHPLG